MKAVLKLKNNMAELDKLHGFIEKLGRKLCLSKKHVVETTIALEEVVSNIIAYAYGNRTDHYIKISVISPVNGALVLRVEDSGMVVEVKEAGAGDLVCCDQPMVKQN